MLDAGGPALYRYAMLHIADHLKAYLHGTALGGVPWLDNTAAGLIDFSFGPLTGVNTRYYWVFLAQAAVLLAIVHAWRGGTWRGFARFCVPEGVLRHPSTLVDIQLNLANQVFGRAFKLFWRLSMPAIAGWLLGGLVAVFGPAPHILHWTVPALLVLTVLVTVGDDLGYYLFHRASHTVPALWAFHKVHHTAETLTPLTAGRVHPVEMALSEPVRAATSAMVMAPALYLFDGQANLVTVLGINLMSLLFGGLGNQLLHSHVAISWGWLDHILVSPAVHQNHHSRARHHWNRNMGGLLSLWDWMFGTLYVPVRGEQISFGLAEGVRQPHPHALAAYLAPFGEVVPKFLLPKRVARQARTLEQA